MIAKTQHWFNTTVAYSLIFGLIIPTFWSVFFISPAFAQTTSTSNFRPPIDVIREQIVSKTHYPNKYFEINPLTGESKSFIYVGDQKIAEINERGDIKYYITDHLGSPNMVVDDDGIILEKTDYLPYGKINYEESSINNDYGFTGKEKDEEIGLNYFEQRYYDSDLGKFVSVDPVLLNPQNTDKLQKVLANPQLLNSYSYTANNPVRYVDPNGKWWKEVITGQQSLSDFQVELGQSSQYLYDNSGTWQTTMDHPYATGATIGVGSGLAYSAPYLLSQAPALINLFNNSDKTQLNSNSLIGQQFAHLGEVIENQSLKLKDLAGFTRHGLNQIINRGIKPEIIKDTLANPLLTFKESGERTVFLSKNAFIVLNKGLEVITAVDKNNFYKPVQDLINLITK